MTPETHLRARRHADHRLLPADRRDRAARSRCRRSPSRAPARATRRPGRCGVTTSRSRCRWTPACGGAATSSRRCGPRSGPTARASTSRHTPRATPSPSVHLRAEQVVDWATRGGAAALGRDDLGRLEPGEKADVVLIKNDDSPVSFPLLNPYGHVAFQSQRGDVHTVIVDGRVVKHEHRAGRARRGRGARGPSRPPSSYLRPTHGRGGRGPPGMNPEMPEDDEVLDNPYQYTEYKSDATHGARGHHVRRARVRGLDGSPRARRRRMAGRGSGPDFVEALARGLDVLACFDAAAPDACRSPRWRRPTGLARPTARRLLLTLEELGFVRSDGGGVRADAEGARRSGRRTSRRWVCGRSPVRTSRRWSARTGESSSMAQLDGSRHRLRGAGLGAQDHRAAGRHRHPLPGAADLAGQGAARRAHPRRARRRPGPAEPRPGSRTTSVGPTTSSAPELIRGPGPRLGARRRGARARCALDRRPRPRRRRRTCGPR